MTPKYDEPPEWPADQCSNCGESQDGIEVEYCEQGEHCEMCCDCDDDWPPGG